MNQNNHLLNITQAKQESSRSNFRRTSNFLKDQQHFEHNELADLMDLVHIFIRFKTCLLMRT